MRRCSQTAPAPCIPHITPALCMHCMPPICTACPCTIQPCCRFQCCTTMLSSHSCHLTQNSAALNISNCLKTRKLDLYSLQGPFPSKPFWLCDCVTLWFCDSTNHGFRKSKLLEKEHQNIRKERKLCSQKATSLIDSVKKLGTICWGVCSKSLNLTLQFNSPVFLQLQNNVVYGHPCNVKFPCLSQSLGKLLRWNVKTELNPPERQQSIKDTFFI